MNLRNASSRISGNTMWSLMIAIALFISLSACVNNQHKKGIKRSQEMSLLEENIADLYANYVFGNINTARQNLHDLIALYDENRGLIGLLNYSDGMYLSYSRISVLEERSGNGNLADAYYLKARYWLLIKRELTDDSLGEAMDYVKGYTKEECIALVDKWDNLATDGKGPNYIKHIDDY